MIDNLRWGLGVGALLSRYLQRHRPLRAAMQAAASAACPTSFYAAGVSINPQATPNLAGWYALALPVTNARRRSRRIQSP